jgi:hypothetical protein
MIRIISNCIGALEKEGNGTITIGEKTVVIHNTLCVPEIDVVYTWVNGSDPRQIEGESL